MLAQRARLGVQEVAVEQGGQLVRQSRVARIAARLEQRQRRFEQVHVRVLAAVRGRLRPLVVEAEAGRMPAVAPDRADRVRGEAERRRIAARAVKVGEREHDERLVVEVGHRIADAAVTPEPARPQSVAELAVRDQKFVAAPGGGERVRPAQDRGMGKDVDLAGLHPDALEIDRDRAAVQAEVLGESGSLGVQADIGPHRQRHLVHPALERRRRAHPRAPIRAIVAVVEWPASRSGSTTRPPAAMTMSAPTVVAIV